jgi:hypothetical protein
MVGKRTLNRAKSQDDDNNMQNGDLEAGMQKKRFGGFKDAVDYAMDRRTTAALKEQLLKSVETSSFDQLRKSDEEVRIPVSVFSRPPHQKTQNHSDGVLQQQELKNPRFVVSV